MAIAVTTDLVDVNLSEATTNYAVLGTWATAIAASPDTYVQSSNTVGGRVSANSAWAHSTTPSANLDLSTGEKHIFQWLKCISVPQLDTKANGGLGITMSSDATPTLTGATPSNGPTNSKTWYVGGNEDALSGWSCFVVDPNSTPDLTLGTPNAASVNRIGIRAKMVGTVGGGAVKPVNIVFDATRYGTGLTYTGDSAGVAGTFADILTTAMSAANAWGILTSDSSIWFGAAKFDFGTTGQTAVSSFKSVGQLFVWRNYPVAATFYAFRLRGAASFNTTFQLGNFSGGLTSGGTVIKGAGDTSASAFAAWTMDVGANAVCNIYGSTLSEMYRGTFQSNSVIRGTTFKNFGNITANGALFDDCVFSDLRTTAPISGTYGVDVATVAATITNSTFVNCATALRWNVATDTNTKLDGTKFISGGTGYGIELGPNTPSAISLASVNFSGYGADGTANAAIYNNSGKLITITVTGTGNSPTVNNGAGASTVIVAGTVPVTLTAQTATGAKIQSANVMVAAAAGGPLPYQASVSIVNSGTTATVTHAGHGMATNDKALIKGASLVANNGIFVITKIDANTYSYTMGSAQGSSPTGSITSTFVALSGLTDVNGQITMSRVFPSSQPVSGWARKSTASPFYKTAPVVGTVSNTTGASLSALMIGDE